MAEFIIRVLKWLAALVVAYFLLFLLAFLVLVGVGVAFQPAPKTVKTGSVLVLDLGFNLTDQPSREDPAQILRSAMQGDVLKSVPLWRVLETIDTAADDPDISGLLLQGNLVLDGYGGSYAALREVRQSILQFRKKKPVWSYLDMDSLRDLYLKTAATEVYCNQDTMVDFRGLRGERLYLGEAFEKIGVEVQVEAFEEFKSAAEAYQRGSMSPEERTQLGELLNDMWDSIIADIAQSRGTSEASLDKVAGSELILRGDEIVHSGLADELLQVEAFRDRLVEVAGSTADMETFRQYDFLDYMDLLAPDLPTLDFNASGNKVGIVYVEGILLDGKDVDAYVGSDRLIKDLKEMRENDAVKSVVIRINSPGGSATASSKVVREIDRLSEEKPVVISMGGMAASAGYMMAASGDEIFAQPSTITGSIGVVIMLPNVEELASKLSLHFEGVETHPFAGSYSIGRRKNAEEMSQIRELTASFYKDFLEHVAKGRNLPYERVREVGKGRVWSGAAALDLGLVDTIGGLQAATQRAADLAGIGNDFEIMERPRAMSFEEQLSEWLTDVSGIAGSRVADHSMMAAIRELEEEFRKLSLLNDPYGQYAMLPYTLKLR